jgi:ubiquinol-cytochrome c reductase cytochrome c1 subunit
MMRNRLAALAALLIFSLPAFAGEDEPPRTQDWPQDGLTGTYNRADLQRGFQVYREVCSACHSMHLLYYRDLEGLGYNPEEIKAIAASVTVTDGPNDSGEMFDRPGRPYDEFKSPYPNVKASRAANGGAYPPDMSLLAKAREGGPDYIYSIVTGYGPTPEGVTIPKGKYYNDTYPGHAISMPPPLKDGLVDFGKDDSGKPVPDDIAHEARDVAEFLAWASEPHLEERHRMGLQVMIFLGVFAAVLYAAKRKIWKDAH